MFLLFYSSLSIVHHAKFQNLLIVLTSHQNVSLMISFSISRLPYIHICAMFDFFNIQTTPLSKQNILSKKKNPTK